MSLNIALRHISTMMAVIVKISLLYKVWEMLNFAQLSITCILGN